MANTTADKLTYLEETKAAIKDAIVSKGVTIPDGTPFREYAGKIGEIKSKVEDSTKNINFYDYDGTLVASWTLEDLASATALPDNPNHIGLTAQGWNWTLAGLKARNKPTDVGQMYITDDGKTRVHVSFRDCLVDDSKQISLWFTQSIPNGVVVDWGDNSPSETFSELEVAMSHEYAYSGEYTISFSPEETCELRSLNFDINQPIFKWAQVGKNCPDWLLYFGIDARRNIEFLTSPKVSTVYMNFMGFTRIRNITIPSAENIELGSEGSYFCQCHSLQALCVPESLISDFGNTLSISHFTQAYCLKRLTIPFLSVDLGINLPSLSYIETDSAEYIGLNPPEPCFPMLKEIIVPASCTDFHLSQGYQMTGLRDLYMLSAIPPVLNTADSFPLLTIHVPAGSLATYQSADVWSFYADCMVEMP